MGTYQIKCWLQLESKDEQQAFDDAAMMCLHATAVMRAEASVEGREPDHYSIRPERGSVFDVTEG